MRCETCRSECRYRLAGPRYTCTLDAADDGPMTHLEIAKILGVSRQRVAQIEAEALQHYREISEYGRTVSVSGRQAARRACRDDV